MSEKERQRLKKQYIKEFRERKHIRQTLEATQKRRNIDAALSRMVYGTEGSKENFDQEAVKHESQDVNDIPDNVQSPAKTIGPRLRSDTSDRNI